MEDYDTDTLEAAMEKFETMTKRKFAGDGEDLIIPVPGLESNRSLGIARGKMTISAAKMKALWEPVITAITTLVSTQIKISKNVKAVLLVGGFGQNPYLKSCVEQVVGPRVEVMQPAKGWTAVVRGALIKGLAGEDPNNSRIAIASRVARKYYGMDCYTRYDPLKYTGRKCHYSGYYGHERVHIMDWFVQKGRTMKETEPIITNWSSHKHVNEGTFTHKIVDLYVYPDRDDIGAPTYPDSPGVKHLTRLHANLSTIPKGEIRVETGADNQLYHVLKFEIHIRFYSAHTEYSLWVKNKCYGRVDAEYI